MIYPVKIEFATSVLGPWTDWSQYLSEPPKISRKVESDNEGEAGLIVFDRASVSLYYSEGNPVYTAFQGANLTSAQRYMFRISAPKSNKTYEMLFEGMADFSTIEWPDESRLVSFEIIDKLSALSILEAKRCKTLSGIKNVTLRNLPALIFSQGEYYSIEIGSGTTTGVIHIMKRVKVDGLWTNVHVNQTSVIFNDGEIIFAGDPQNEEDGKMYFVKSSILSDNEYDGSIVDDTYLQGVPDNDEITGVYRIDSSDSDAYLLSNPSVKLKFYNAGFYNSDFIKTSLLPHPGFPLAATDTVIGFDGVQAITAIVRGQWYGTALIDRMGEFIIPIEYWRDLIFEDPFGEMPLDALKMLADSMQCYIFFDKAGKLVIQKKSTLATNGTARSFGSTRIIDGTTKFFWDKLIDGVTVEAKSWLMVNQEHLVGVGSLYKQITGSNNYVKPKNELTKKVLAGSSSLTSQAELDTYAAQLADQYMAFYGVRRYACSYTIALDDNTLIWDLLDNIALASSQYFFSSIEYDLDKRIIDIELVDCAGSDWDKRNVAIPYSERSYNSGGGSYSGATGGVSAASYLWSGSAVGLNASLGRQSLGLNNILNLGDGIIGNTEFNALDGVTSNIQTQLNSKENILSFVGPLVRSGNQISFSYNASNFKMTGGAFDTAQDIHTGASVQFSSANLIDSLSMSGAVLSDAARNIYAGRIGVGGDPDFTSYVFKAHGSGYFTGNILVDGDIYIGGRINQVNVNDLYVVDKNIILNRGGDNTTAINAGIKVEGASASVLANLLFDGTNWTHSHDVNTASGKGYKVNGAYAIDGSRNYTGGEGSFTGQLAWNGNSRSDNGFVFFRVNGNTQSGRFRALQVSTTYTGTIPDNGILFGTDANLYRSAAGILKTDNNFLFTGYIAHPSYASQTSNWRISSTGEADFRYIYADELHTKAFIADLEQALAGGEIIGKSVAKIAADFTLPAAGGQVVIEVESFAGFPSSYVFQNNDWLEIKKFDRPVTADTIGLDIGIAYGRVQFVAGSFDTEKKTQKWIFTRDAAQPGAASGIVKAGTLAIDKGVTGNGYIESSAIDGPNGINSPYVQTAYWLNHPANKFVGARMGNMRGIAGNPWREQSIHGLYADVAWLTDNVVIGGRSLGLMQGITALFHFDDNLRDSISGINASYTGTLNETVFGLVSSSDNTLVCTKVNGKFGGGVAVEEATTNLITSGGFEFDTLTGTGWSFWGSGTRSIVSGYRGKGYYMEGASSAVGISSSAIAAVSGTTYTIQVKAKGDHLNYFYILKASGNVNISALAAKKYLEGGWYQLTYTVTCSVTEIWNILFAYYNYAKGVIDEAQVEAKPYATSFVEGSRAYGSLKFANDLQAEKSYSFWFKYEGVPGTPTWIFHSNNSSTQRLGLVIGTSYAIDVAANGYYNTGYNLNNINGQNLVGQWVYCVITVSSNTMNFYLNGVLIKSQSYTGALPTNPICLGSAQASTLTSVSYDEFSSFNRVLTENEIKKIYYSGQPLQESPGMTYISGNRLRTGDIYSENYIANSQGMRIGLNAAYMEMNYGGNNIFRFDSAAGVANIAGWGFNSERLEKISGNKAIYLLSLETGAWGLQMDLYYGGSPTADGIPKWLSVGRVRYGNGSVSDNYGFCISDRANNKFFEASVPMSGGAGIYKIAGWNFDISKLYNSATISSTTWETRLEASTSFVGLAVKTGSYDRVKIGAFTGTHPDTSIDSTLTYMNDPTFTGSLISYASSGYGSTPGAWATRGTITWSITSGYLQIYSATDQPEADTWCTFKNASSLNNKTVLVEFDLTVASNLSAIWTPRVLLDFYDGDVNGNGTDMSKFSQYLIYKDNGTYHISAYVTFGTGAYKVLHLNSGSGTTFKIVRIDNFTIKEYPDVYTYINGSGLEVYKSPIEYFSFLNGNFNIALNELYINSILNVSKSISIGNYKIAAEGDKLVFYIKSGAAYTSIGYLENGHANTPIS